MSGAPAEIDIVATDDASDVFQEVSSNFTDVSSNVSEASDVMSIDVSDSMQQTSRSACFRKKFVKRFIVSYSLYAVKKIRFFNACRKVSAFDDSLHE